MISTANSSISAIEPSMVPVVVPQVTHAARPRKATDNVDAFFASYDGFEQQLDDKLQSLESLVEEYDLSSVGSLDVESVPAPTSQLALSLNRPTRTRPSPQAPYVIPPLGFEPPAGFVLSIVIPAFNEVRTIATILDRVFALPVEKEVIVIDDCSLDGTGRVLRSMLGRPGLRVIFKEKNEGKGAALRDGFRAARGDVVVVQDADLEYDPREIPKLLEAILLDGCDVAYGSRYLESSGDGCWWHRWGNAILTGSSNLTTGLDLTDMETCYKAFKRRVLDRITVQQNRFGFEPEITAKIARHRFRIREVPIGYRARGYQDGKKIRWKDALNAFYCIVRYGLFE